MFLLIFLCNPTVERSTKSEVAVGATIEKRKASVVEARTRSEKDGTEVVEVEATIGTEIMIVSLE